MSILQIVYRSLAREGFDEPEMLDILRVSQIRNQRERISGLLVYRAPVFVQLLEGPPDAVLALYERIARDPRHQGVEVVLRQEAAQAAMPTWAMGYLSETAGDCTGPEDAFVFDYAQARSLCEALPPAIGAPFLEVLGVSA